ALISQGKTYRLATVPEIPADTNQRKEVIHISLDNNKIVGTGHFSAHGLIASKLRNMIGDNQRKRKDFVFSLLQKGNNKSKLNEYTEKDFSETQKPYAIDYAFELENYVVSAGNEIYVNMTMDKPFQNDTFEPTRKQTYDNEYLQNQTYEVWLNLPPNSQVMYIPEDVTFENELMKYQFLYKKQDNQVCLHYQIQTKTTLIKPHQFALWNESIKKLKENYLETIIITQS